MTDDDHDHDIYAPFKIGDRVTPAKGALWAEEEEKFIVVGCPQGYHVEVAPVGEPEMFYVLASELLLEPDDAAPFGKPITGWTVTGPVDDAPLEHSNADSLELDPEAVEAKLGELSQTLGSLRDRVEERLTVVDAIQQPILHHRLDPDTGPYIRVADCELEGASVYATPGNPTGVKVYDALLSEEPPEPPSETPPQPSYEPDIREARADGFRRGYRTARETAGRNLLGLAATSALCGAAAWVLGVELVVPALQQILTMVGCS